MKKQFCNLTIYGSILLLLTACSNVGIPSNKIQKNENIALDDNKSKHQEIESKVPLNKPQNSDEYNAIKSIGKQDINRHLIVEDNKIDEKLLYTYENQNTNGYNTIKNIKKQTTNKNSIF